MQEDIPAMELLVGGISAMTAWVAKVFHARQNRLEERINQLTDETQRIVGTETRELRRVIDRNHEQVMNILESRAQIMLRRRGDE